MPSKTSRFLIIISFLTLAACKAEIISEWERYHSQAQNGESRVEWLSDISVDPYGDIISAGSTVLVGADRQKNILVVKHNAGGEVIWVTEHDLAMGAYRSDDKITDMVLDDEGNVYLIGVRYIVERDQQRYGSFMMKIDHYGDIDWINELSDQEDARDLEINNGQLYVTGFATQVFSLNGRQQLKIDHDKAWDIEVDDAGYIYIVGATKAEKYSAGGELIWVANLAVDLYPRASLALQQDGSVVVAHNQDDRSTSVTGISSDGVIQWGQTFSAPTQSYGLPGPALVKADWRGDIVLSLSNDRSRRIVKLSESGKEQWQVTSKGIIQDILIGFDGSIYAVGGGVNEKYDDTGKFIAATVQTAGTQLTTGSVAMDGENMYVGYSAVNEGEIDFYLAKFIDD
jgi:hypothetical protein